MPSSVPQSMTITATGQIISNGERSVSPSEVVASKNFSDGSNRTPLSNPITRNPQIGAMQTLDHLDNLDNLIEQDDSFSRNEKLRIPRDLTSS